MEIKQGNVVADHYRLIKELGRGSYGNVWLCHDELSDIDVALKFYSYLDDKGLDEFRSEFKITYKLNHPNLLHVMHFDVFDNVPFLIMPYCSNGSLASRRDKMTEEEIWRFVKDVSSGIEYMHSQQPPIIHQDIKPDNILIADDGSYVISDFGISRHMKTKLSKSINLGSNSGTLAYMSPERFSEEPISVKASDIWSFGMTLLELITGEVLWEGMGGCAQLNGARIPSLEGCCSRKLAYLTTWCLQVNPWERPTATQILDYIKQSHHDNMSLQSNNIMTNNNYKSYQDESHASHVQKRNYNKPVKKEKDNNILRYSIIAAGSAIALVLFFLIFSLVSSINEDDRYYSCKTIDDYEQFIEDYPESSYTETAKARIAELKKNTHTDERQNFVKEDKNDDTVVKEVSSKKSSKQTVSNKRTTGTRLVMPQGQKTTVSNTSQSSSQNIRP